MDKFWARHRIRNQQQTSNVSTYTRLNATNANNVLSIDNANYDKSTLPNDSIQLQCLDVGSLLKINEKRDYRRLQYDSITEGTLSYAGSSLDLEWEHEYGGNRNENQQELTYSWYYSQEDSSSSSSDEGNGHSIELSQMTTSSARLNRQNNNYQPITTLKQRKQQKLNNQNELYRCSSTTKFDGENRSKANTSRSHISTPDSLEWDTHDDEQKFKSEEDSLDQETVDLLNEIEWLKNRALFETGDAQWKSQNEES